MGKLIVSASPHIHDGSSTSRIMLDVIIALSPAVIASTIFFGPRALLLIAVTVSVSVFSELLSRRIMKRSTDTYKDLSAVVTGLLLALSLPVTMPLWMASLGAIVAIVIVKQIFGGLGHNFVNPAIVGRLFLMFSYPIATNASWSIPLPLQGVDAVTQATPLIQISNQEPMNLWHLFLGMHGGSMGETSILALFIGGMYLVYRKIIRPTVPLIFIGTTCIIVLLAGQNPLLHLMSGSLVFVAIFMATDYVTSPITAKGRIVFAVGCGFITAVIRLFGALPEGVSFAILIMNILVPHIERVTVPKVFGDTTGG